MSTISDPHLGFLATADIDDLGVLVHILTSGQNGQLRVTETLTHRERYVEHFPDHHKYLDLIVQELRMYGGNSIVNLARGDGVPYEVIVTDVCSRLKLRVESRSVPEMEQAVLTRILEDAISHMSDDEITRAIEALGPDQLVVGRQALIAIAQQAVRKGGFLPYKLTVIVANYVVRQVTGRGLSLALNAALTRGLSVFAGPIGWAINGIWALADIASPAFRVTLPSVVQIAYMRTKHEKCDEG